MPLELTIECHPPSHDRPSSNNKSGPNGSQNGNHDHGTGRTSPSNGSGASTQSEKDAEKERKKAEKAQGIINEQIALQKMGSEFEQAMYSIFSHGTQSAPVKPTPPPIDPKKDAIEPFYGIEETLFGSVATLATLYKMGALLFNKPIPKIDNKFNTDPSKVGHIFRNKSGHFTENTAENRNLILEVCNDKKNCIGFDTTDNIWYAQTFTKTSSQVWVRVRNGIITNAGLNKNVLDLEPDFIALKIKYGMKP